MMRREDSEVSLVSSVRARNHPVNAPRYFRSSRTKFRQQNAKPTLNLAGLAKVDKLFCRDRH